MQKKGQLSCRVREWKKMSMTEKIDTELGGAPISKPSRQGLLVTDATNFLRALRRLHDKNDGILFWNEEQSFKIMLRSDMINSETYNFELVIVYDPTEDLNFSFETLLEMEHDGFMDDDNCSFIMDDFEVNVGAQTTDDDVILAMKKINALYSTRVCPCFRYFIKDSVEEACPYCVLSASRQDDAERLKCPICQETSMGNQLSPQPCCKQSLHPRCLAAWHGKPCPLCRAPSLVCFDFE